MGKFVFIKAENELVSIQQLFDMLKSFQSQETFGNKGAFCYRFVCNLTR